MIKLIQATTIALVTLTATAALADRRPNTQERASLADVLHANGYVSWKEIEWDDGRWEVDDARHKSGKVYDLDIRDGRIVHREREWN